MSTLFWIPAIKSSGMYAFRPFTAPVVKPVSPEYAPCTAEWARRVQKMLSDAIVGSARNWYVLFA